ncbi:M23 family metallopeptidase [Limosilactobacillus fastidiosus]|uniref:M23 family metallopeptidase n=1 Tax=Limosilactobacillus fastidiosus TaxID=2759855 RepID=A0ABR6E7G6_9LACO|nr:M23 family metallopeptidase [Limosilactobacillus fastidiosus]MBB1063143.1 M23 family metallopeptidase [Limosilactobacillus fastidiosus]MCD7084919.1 M23 family metallopeptidase [Limosilactobacillus fastidiosus]
MEENIIFNLKNFKSKVLPTITVCGSALFLMHGKASADQIDTTNQKQTDAQVQTMGTNTGASNDNNNNNQNNSAVADSTQQTNDASSVATNTNSDVNASSAVTYSAHAASSVTNNQAETAVSYDQNDHGNYAYLDSAKVDNNDQVQLSGWHATNESSDKPYHYVIAYDNTTKSEISRTQVTDPVSRPDVQSAHNVYGANKSGFNVKLDLSSVALANADSISFISRYSAAKDGNSNYVDYWFAPITFDKENHASLDDASVQNGQLHISGWHATNQAADKLYHTVILYDQTENKEIARQVVTPVKRQDVANAYPGVADANMSGFDINFNLSNVNLNHKIQVISRYSKYADANSNYVDYWFTPITNGNYTNQANLDNFNISNGQTLKVSGWHADDISQLESNHYLILFDNTTNKQVTSVKIKNNSRADVAKAYPSVQSAGQSGFNYTFNLSDLNLTSGHSYSLVSRYSTSTNGNGSDGQYTDYWFKPVVLNQQAYNIDSIKMTSAGLQLSGWMASDNSINRNNAFIIVLNDGKEVARQKVELASRPDVANVYGSIYNSVKSGFSTTVKLDPTAVTGTMQIIMRFSSDVNGNSDYSDQYSQKYTTNVGSFDNIEVTDNGIYVSGWHASNLAANKPYEFLIFVDQNGKELYRQQVLDRNRTRNDVANVYPYIANSGKSGYQLGFTIPDSLNHHTVQIIDRLTDDVYGNGNYVDIKSNPVSINDEDYWAWPFPADGQGRFMGAQLFGVNPGGEFRLNGFHDGLDFGSIDHPGSQVHAIHSGKIVGVGYGSGIDWYVLEDTGEYLIVYQEAFSSRSKINVSVGQEIKVGDVIGTRDTSHVHIGITRQHNYSLALKSSFINNGTWLNPLTVIKNGLKK